jgi:hypothetical protein
MSRRSTEQAEIRLLGATASPPGFAVRQAAEAAADSGCRTSRRGVSVYWSEHDLGPDRELACDIPGGEGFNGPPWRWRGTDPLAALACDASDACQRDCGRRCMHAEVRAFLATVACGAWWPRDRLRMVHVKVDAAGGVIPSGGPRCLPCATFLLDQGVGGIWLYELEGLWRFYRMEEFYAVTTQACAVYDPVRGALL